jgi:hypothetical protein
MQSWLRQEVSAMIANDAHAPPHARRSPVNAGIAMAEKQAPRAAGLEDAGVPLPVIARVLNEPEAPGRRLR